MIEITEPITIHTHNGKSPAEGGKRLGYSVAGVYAPIGGTLDGLLNQLRSSRNNQTTPVIQASQTSEVVRLRFDDLPRRRDRQECEGCYRFVRLYEWYHDEVDTDCGLVTVVVCPYCRTQQR